MKPEDVEENIEVWPENSQAVDLFRHVGTQWRVGAGGATGLDYNVLYHKMDRMKLTAERYEELEEEIRILEGAALEVMHEKKE